MTDNNKALEEMKSFYDDVYYANADKPLQNFRHLSGLATKLKIASSDSVLDIACGLGEWLKVCDSRGANVHGIDLSQRAIDYCKKQIPSGEFFAQAAEVLPFDNESFDYVTCLGSLEHFVDPVIALKEMARVSKRGARFVILVPNADFLTRKLKLYYGTNQKDAKEVVRTLDEWERLFNEAGLTVTSKWKDLHVLSWAWISMNGWTHAPIRGLQALALALWPLKWQYQVYHLCEKSKA
ncbi:MAG: class I SAM-dependent methyltransferase [Proteobacteria bacterium]|nr:class I SAM-dependent methyltransferase [Pseudomonadota bacterium]